MTLPRTALFTFLTLSLLTLSPSGTLLAATEAPKPAEATSVSQASAPKKPDLALSLRTAYYEMQGKRWASSGLYGFDDAALNLQILTASYALSPRLSLTATTAYNRTYLETATRTIHFTDTIRGLTDTKILARQLAWMGAGQMVMLEGGLSLPTGSINIPNPRVSTQRLGYNLQLGSGTIDPVVAASYVFSSGSVTTGARAQGTFRLANNKNSYHWGNEYAGNLWADYRLIGNALVPGLRLNAKTKGSIHGQDPAIARNIATEFYFSPQSSWDLTFVTRSTLPIGLLGATLALEAGLPLAQDTINAAGYHIATQFYGTAGIQVEM